jgi:hypothetical protein
MVFQGYNPSNWEAETGVQDQPVHNDLVSKKKKKAGARCSGSYL